MEGKIGHIHPDRMNFQGEAFTNEQFVNLLLAETDPTPQSLPASMHLPGFRESIDFLYSNFQLVHAYDPQFRDHMEQEITSGKFAHLNFDAKEELRAAVSKKVAGERGVVFSVDDNNSLQASETFYGEEREVSFERPERLRFLIHTHPNNVPFSPLDTTHLLLMEELDRRGMRSEMVLGPDFQLIALATSETPILLPTDIKATRDHYDSQYLEDESPEVERNIDRHQEVHDRYLVNIRTANDWFEQVKEIVAQNVLEGTMTQTEADEAILNEAKRRDRVLRREERRRQKVIIPRAERVFQMEMSHEWTRQSRMARELNIAWYISDDRENFSRVEPGNVVVR